MKLMLVGIASLLLSGCYTTTTKVYTAPVSYGHTQVVQSQPTVIYSEYSPPVIVRLPNCYTKNVPLYSTRQVITQPDGSSVVIGSAVGAGIGAKLADGDEVLGAIAGAIIGGSIANTPQVRTQRIVIGTTQQRVCDRY